MSKKSALAGLGMMMGMGANPYGYGRGKSNTDMRSHMSYFNQCAKKNKHRKK